MLAATAASCRARGTFSAPEVRATMAMTGRAIRARTFQTPVTIAEVEISRRENPHVRQMAYVAAAGSPTAGEQVADRRPAHVDDERLVVPQPGQ